MDKEVNLKKDIILKLCEQQEIIKRHIHDPEKQHMPEQFIRGFISGAETMKEIKLPSDWYGEIVEAIAKCEK